MEGFSGSKHLVWASPLWIISKTQNKPPWAITQAPYLHSRFTRRLSTFRLQRNEPKRYCQSTISQDLYGRDDLYGPGGGDKRRSSSDSFTFLGTSSFPVPFDWPPMTRLELGTSHSPSSDPMMGDWWTLGHGASEYCALPPSFGHPDTHRVPLDVGCERFSAAEDSRLLRHPLHTDPLSNLSKQRRRRPSLSIWDATWSNSPPADCLIQMSSAPVAGRRHWSTELGYPLNFQWPVSYNVAP
ncbi:hypothetical protein NEUTE1DRAFT_109238 [Neurospora tetrasperma FGSC 2508]|uniref:Uncharacterized protein n=1 Tax=Neurospora tetrasperma (strain FGSC 2508 / ATCC MYA-4615 / P0657) TaxID=510951 RepID=F8MIA6_NEUT8|nr:uncharacterized protein NEUTE1DRAFT_109238 [Neurospora tetrasperma FGSC 2508]EGO59760.1 hypothetical protein NEUTE1DRAFT_109238 [Neurospora tetrasperma FGSC 2508]EGZ73905.1 hypothetical protein NEUTE2DRAFT_62834 [Neurospora tetrasperma FGSC 2509]